VSQPDRSELFLGWNLSPSEDNAPARSGQAWSLTGRPGGPRDRARPWDETRSIARPDPAGVDPSVDFALHRDHEEPSRGMTPAGRTYETAREVLQSDDQAIPFPRCGDGIGGFRLISELGQGAFGRVYLAEESGLGNRSVALKVTRPEGEEPRLLARLQHTHIVPIHSVQDDPETGLRLMCMPYFGGADLAQVLEATGHGLATQATGLSLVEALDAVGRPASIEGEGEGPRSIPRGRRSIGPSPVLLPDAAPMAGSSMPLRSILGRIPWWSRSLSTPPRLPDERDPVQPARRFLRESTFVRASAWIAARLAEGLEHAHSRGLLHRDLKPSNILIAADGTPMLLDFNLAAECVCPDGGDRAMVGGTLPYMAPEHLDAYNPNGSTPPEAVDERADIYSLGLILFEMIAGQHPFPEPPPGLPLLEVVVRMTEERRGPAPSPREFNPEVSRGLDAIVRKCLDPDPDRRHARAGDLAEDLRRFLDDRPLKFTPEPSLLERLAKWARRNPKITGATPVALISMALIVLIGGAAWSLSRHIQHVSARLKLRVFERSFLESQFLLNVANGPSKNMGRGIGLAEEALRQAGVDAWGDRSRSWLAALEPEEQLKMRGDLSELILLTARARVYQAERSKSEEKRRRALEEAIVRLDRAEKLDPNPSQALFADRASYHSALGDAGPAAKDRARRDATPPTTGRDFYLLGTSLLAQGQPDRAELALTRAIGLDPRRFWAWFSLGLCHYDQGRFADSAGDFAVCAVLAPRFAWPWMNRGLALTRAGRLLEAREAYNRAVEADGRIAEALANRGLTCLELGDAPAAVDDLEKSIARGLRDPSIRAALGEALARAGRRGEGLHLLAELIEAEPDAVLPRIARGMLLLSADPKVAEADFRRVLAGDPRHPVANLGLARLLRVADPRASLVHAELAVTGDPNRLDALELRAWLRGRLGDPSAVADVDRLILTPTPHRLYNAACALALLSESRADPALIARALELLRRAIESGLPTDSLRNDPDLNSLKSSPTFRKWIEPAGPNLK
jgi:serine/threonine protein kinase/tetratricopeptide (TPR) repeat protein